MIKYYSDFNNSFNGRHIYIFKKVLVGNSVFLSSAATDRTSSPTPSDSRALHTRAQILVRLAHTLRLKLSRAPSKTMLY